jgi:LuxR family maltose regulon positive regulatory protein
MAATCSRVVWYSLDERDRDPTIFGQHLLVASGEPPDGVTAWRMRDAAAADDLADRVIRCAALEEGPVALVLDDYHVVAGVQGIDATLNRLLRDRPANLRIGLVSRSPLELRVARLRAQGLVADLGSTALRFTPAEAAAALDNEQLSAADEKELYTLTDGWPAAVQLLGDAWAEGVGTSSNGSLRAWSRREGVDALIAEEIIPQLTPAEVSLLGRLSVLPEIQAHSCQAVTAEPEAFERLQQLATRFSFIADVDGQTYRIHQLVRAYLASRLGAEERRAALEHAATAFEARDQPIEAGWVALQLDDTTRLADLIKREARRLIAQGRAATLGEWFAHVPWSSVESDPALLARHAHLLAEEGEIDAATRQFTTASNALAADGKASAAGDVLRVMAGVFEQRGDYARARDALTQAAVLLPEPEGALAVALWSQVAILRLHDGDPDGAESLAREVVARTDAAADAHLLAVAYHNLGHILSTRGRLGEAVHAYRQALDLKRRHGLHASEALSLNGLGIAYLHQGQLEPAEKTLMEAEKLARAHGGHLVASYAVSNLGDVCRERGDVERAESLYRRSLQEKEKIGSRYALAYTWNSLAELYRQTGDLEQARAFNARALGLRANEAGPIEYQVYRAEAGRIALASGDHANARAQLAPSTAELRRLGCERLALRAAWSLGAACWRSESRIDVSLVALLDAAERSADPPNMRALVVEAPDLAVALWAGGARTASLLAALRAPGMEVRIQAEISRNLSASKLADSAAEALLDLLAALPGYAPLVALAEAEHADQVGVRRAAAQVLARLRAEPAPPLDIHGFGALRVERRGQVVPERAWRRQRSLELLGLLLLAGPGGRSRDELIVECWPEASPEAGIAQFHAHLHALRSALEPEAARGTSRYVLADGRNYHLAFESLRSWDVGSFERVLQCGRNAEARADLPEAERAFEAASELYRGPLFEGLSPEGEWLEVAREGLRRQATETRVRLAQLREAAGNPRGAEAAWRDVLALDPLREDAHCALISTLLALGQRDAALDAFRQCADVLERELGVAPGPRTLALYQRALRS